MTTRKLPNHIEKALTRPTRETARHQEPSRTMKQLTTNNLSIYPSLYPSLPLTLSPSSISFMLSLPPSLSLFLSPSSSTFLSSCLSVSPYPSLLNYFSICLSIPFSLRIWPQVLLFLSFISLHITSSYSLSLSLPLSPTLIFPHSRSDTFTFTLPPSLPFRISFILSLRPSLSLSF